MTRCNGGASIREMRDLTLALLSRPWRTTTWSTSFLLTTAMARGPVSNELFLLNKGHFPAVVELAQKPVYPDAFGKTIG